MTAALADYYADRLAALPFLSREAGARVVGLARLHTSTGAGDNAPTVRVPVPQAFTADDCERDPRYLVPDQQTPAIFFFEDGGTTDYGIPNSSLKGKESTLRLLGWFQPRRLSAPLSENQLLQALESALRVRQRHSFGEYRDLLTTATVLPAETSLFGRYTYDTETPLLLPPFRLVGLELKCRYLPAPACPAEELPTIVNAASCPSTPSTSFFTRS